MVWILAFTYSIKMPKCLKSERSSMHGLSTEQNRWNYNCCQTEGLCPKSELLRISAFHCTVDVRKQNGSVALSKNRMKLFGFQTSFENRMISQPNQPEKRQNPNVWISDVYCTLNFGQVTLVLFPDIFSPKI